MKTYRIAAIPGDGIGTEVVSAGIEVLHALARREGSFQFKVDHFDWGGEYYKKHGRMMPEHGRDLIRNHDAIYLSPQQAKALWNVLGQNVAQYEQAFGTLSLEPQTHSFPQGPVN